MSIVISKNLFLIYLYFIIKIQFNQNNKTRMINEGQMCQKHQQEISFICVGNVWHFEPLCNACIPQHTKNHPKSIKVQLEALKQILPKANQLKKKVSGVFQERLKKCSIFEEVKEDQRTYIASLNHKRQDTIKQVNAFFDDLISQIRKRRAQEEHSQKLNLSKISQQIKDKIAFFKKEDYLDLSSFCNEIKKYYFKDNMEIYVEQMDQVLQDYEEKLIKYDPFAWSKDLPLKLKKLLEESYKLEDTTDKKNLKEKIQAKKQTKKKQIGRKRCPTCKEEMEYLTEWKKHLVCRNCGNKQRNYTKKA